MRILFLTNFYPPVALGGQGESCQQAVQALRRRGHEAAVLTSSHRASEVDRAQEPDVHRLLHLEMDLTPWRNAVTFFTRRGGRERENLHSLDRLLDQFRPDVVFVWGMWNLQRTLPARLEERLPGRVAYRFAEYWPTLPSQHVQYWQAGGRSRLSSIPKQLVGRLALTMLAQDEPPPALKFEHCYCVSQATKNRLVEAGVPVKHARVIHTGLPLEGYRSLRAQATSENEPGLLRMIYAGRLAADKGVHTCIEALGQLAGRGEVDEIVLSLAGGGSAPYLERLQGLVRRFELDQQVRFLGKMPAEQMPALYRQHDVMLVPSIWPEPFARVILEGMASELAVVATPTGGTGEIVEDGQNGLLFAPDDPGDLAAKIARLKADPVLRRRLAHAGVETVEERFSEGQMLDKIEAFLREAAAGSATFATRPEMTSSGGA